MAQANAFPAFVSVDFDNSRNGFREFRTAAADAGRDVRRQFETDMDEVKRTIARALTLPPNAGGGFNFDTAGMRQAASQAEITAQATREVARALEAAARASDDNTASTRRQIQAAQAAANEAEQEARALSAKAATYERVQAEISRAGTQLQTFAGASRTAAASQGALRQASIGAGQQLQDMAISLYSGQRAGVVFAQQLPQLAFALSALEGSTNKALGTVGRFGIAARHFADGECDQCNDRNCPCIAVAPLPHERRLPRRRRGVESSEQQTPSPICDVAQHPCCQEQAGADDDPIFHWHL